MSSPASQIEYYARALRAPRIGGSFARLGEQARESGWSHEEYLAAVLSREVSEREASGAALRIKAARFPGHKTVEDFNFDHQLGADRNLIAHLGTGVFLSEARNVVLLGPPGTGKTHLAVALGIKAAKAGHRVLFDTATGWIDRLQEAHSRGKLPAELIRLRRYRLLVCDEVGYVPFDQDAANLFFQLVSSRYEHASLIQQPGFRPLGRRLRRPGHRLSHDRSHRPPRRRHQPQRQQLPPQEPPTATRYDTLEPHTSGPVFKRQ